jgi:hypothetical protein
VMSGREGYEKQWLHAGKPARFWQSLGAYGGSDKDEYSRRSHLGAGRHHCASQGGLPKYQAAAPLEIATVKGKEMRKTHRVVGEVQQGSIECL